MDWKIYPESLNYYLWLKLLHFKFYQVRVNIYLPLAKEVILSVLCVCVCLCVCMGALLCLDRVTFDLDFWYFLPLLVRERFDKQAFSSRKRERILPL